MTPRPRPGAARPARPGRGDSGAAIVEFAVLVPVLLVPLVYLLLAVFRVQGASYAVTSAAREAARAYVTTQVGDDPAARASAAAVVALRDHDLELDPANLHLDCSADPCMPGAVITVRMAASVSLPFVPRSILGRHPAAVDVSARHQQVVDRFRVAPASPSATPAAAP